ncbi:MAG TPA: ribosome silencing factor [Candidatus Gastranaerophilales bacterium]|nr:ribosome silencing factor [Candidatus Gastranaerophilales bacterium]
MLKDLSSRELACIIAGIMNEKLAKDIEILNISNISVISDYFVICGAASSVQVRAISGYISQIIKEKYERQALKEEKDLKNRWHLLDYGDVIAHVMHQEERQYYALEKFWSHACKITPEEWLKQAEDSV